MPAIRISDEAMARLKTVQRDYKTRKQLDIDLTAIANSIIMQVDLQKLLI